MSIQDTTSTIASGAKRFFSGTLISRCSGLIREVAMAAVFGTSPSVAAFWMAFRFAHLLRRIFGEGALHTAFVPHFESLRQVDPKAGAHFFYQLSAIMMALLLVITVGAEGILGIFIVKGSISKGAEEVIRLTMILLPALLFICLYALNTSLLQCERIFFLPSVAPTFLNLVWIGAIFLVYKLPQPPAIEYLAMMIVVAFALQWLTTMPPVVRYLKEYRSEKSVSEKKEWVKILKPFSLGIIGVAATQVNSALDSLFARGADPEGPAYLWYALRIQQLPLAIVGVALTGALLPPLSRAIQKQEKEQSQHFLHFALKQALVLMIPITAALFCLGFSTINLVYGHGVFSQVATIQTTQCLWAYGSAIVPMTLVLILASAFYAQKNYLIPTTVSLMAVLLNITLNACLVYIWDGEAVSIAIATAMAASLNAVVLAYFLHRSTRHPYATLLPLFLRITAASVLASVITLAYGSYFLQDNTVNHLLGKELTPCTRYLPTQLFHFSSLALLFSSSFFLAAYLLRCREFFALIPTLRKRAFF